MSFDTRKFGCISLWNFSFNHLTGVRTFSFDLKHQEKYR